MSEGARDAQPRSPDDGATNRLPLPKALARAFTGGILAAVYGLLIVALVFAPVTAAIGEAADSETFTLAGFLMRLPEGFRVALTSAFFLGFFIALPIGPVAWFFADRKSRVDTRKGAWVGAIVGGIAAGHLIIFAIGGVAAGAAAGALAAFTANRLIRP